MCCFTKRKKWFLTRFVNRLSFFSFSIYYIRKITYARSQTITKSVFYGTPINRFVFMYPFCLEHAPVNKTMTIDWSDAEREFGKFFVKMFTGSVITFKWSMVRLVHQFKVVQRTMKRSMIGFLQINNIRNNKNIILSTIHM